MGMRWEVGDAEYRYNGLIAKAGRMIGKDPDHGVVVIDVLELADFARTLRSAINSFEISYDNVNSDCFQMAKACNCLTNVLAVIHSDSINEIVFA